MKHTDHDFPVMPRPREITGNSALGMYHPVIVQTILSVVKVPSFRLTVYQSDIFCMQKSSILYANFARRYNSWHPGQANLERSKPDSVILLSLYSVPCPLL
jgi:hypothetical protein